MSSFYNYWLVLFVFIVSATLLIVFVSWYAGFAILFLFFLIILFYYTLDYPSNRTVYVKQVSPNGSERVMRKIEEIDEDGDGDVDIEKEEIVIEEPTSSSEEEVIVKEVKVPVRRKRKSVPKKKKTMDKKR